MCKSLRHDRRPRDEIHSPARPSNRPAGPAARLQDNRRPSGTRMGTRTDAMGAIGIRQGFAAPRCARPRYILSYARAEDLLPLVLPALPGGPHGMTLTPPPPGQTSLSA